MPSSPRVESRLRILLALLALAANLIAAGVPLLHAAAHAVHEGEPHHAAAPAPTAAEVDHHHGEPHHAEPASRLAAVDHADHDHGAIHPAALHDDAAPKGRSGVGFAFVTAADLPVLHVTLHERRDFPIPVPRFSSRAPPPGDPARAPPLA